MRSSNRRTPATTLHNWHAVHPHQRPFQGGHSNMEDSKTTVNVPCHHESSVRVHEFREGETVRFFRLPSGLSRRSHNWSATMRPSTFSGFRRVCPGGATTVELPSGRPPFPASVGFIPAEPQLVSYHEAVRFFRLPSGLSRRSHNWSATMRPSTFSGFRRVYPGGATTGQLPSGRPLFPASVGSIPAEPQLVSYHEAVHLFRLPSVFRRSHDWSATTTRYHTFGRVPGLPSRRYAFAPNQAAACFGSAAAPFCR